jgi:hypothetical protein
MSASLSWSFILLICLNGNAIPDSFPGAPLCSYIPRTANWFAYPARRLYQRFYSAADERRTRKPLNRRDSDGRKAMASVRQDSA